jgi:hypothetical protein
MTQSHEYRRNRDGSIDFDFYRTQAVALRAQAMRDGFKLRIAFRFSLITLTLLAGATLFASMPAQWISRSFHALAFLLEGGTI